MARWLAVDTYVAIYEISETGMDMDVLRRWEKFHPEAKVPAILIGREASRERTLARLGSSAALDAVYIYMLYACPLRSFRSLDAELGLRNVLKT